ncbi:MAG TPA: isocitrate lyase/phosphoenolpyruvate mutase family protein [Steroidobacteraceae bacterium]|nr:isocitrate lyase/phosphoenolpyruvate mutase family protein [Steroidobacteraceae bacterium]
MNDTNQLSRAQAFRALHDRGTFVIANCWDGGSARILQSSGFLALATSSGAAAGTYGRLDGTISLDEAMAHSRIICSATTLPVSADLEKGFGDAPDATAKAIRFAAGVGLVGGSIEDSTGRNDDPIFPLTQSVERVAAAAEAARSLPFPFTLTARSENFLRGRIDLDDTIRRLQAYEAAGADVLFAPGLPTLDAVRTVCSSVSKPVNFMVGIRGRSFSVQELADAGVRRISLATSLYRAAMTGLADAAREIRETGTFGYVDDTMTSADFAAHLAR